VFKTSNLLQVFVMKRAIESYPKGIETCYRREDNTMANGNVNNDAHNITQKTKE